mgnify:CR=1 FL=1
MKQKLRQFFRIKFDKCGKKKNNAISIKPSNANEKVQGMVKAKFSFQPY